MKAKLVIDDEAYDLGIKDLTCIINALPDDSQAQEVFDLLAESSSAGIRKAVAGKSTLDPEMMDTLLMDDSPRVSKALLSNGGFLEQMTEEQLEIIIDTMQPKDYMPMFDRAEFISNAAVKCLPYLLSLNNLGITKKYREYATDDIFICNMDLSMVEYLTLAGDEITLQNMAYYIDDYAHEFCVCEYDEIYEWLMARGFKSVQEILTADD